MSDHYIDDVGYDELGYVPDGGSLSYTHFFAPYADPSIDVTSIDSSYLYLAVVDDARCADSSGCLVDWFFQSETAVVDLNDVTWQQGSATAHIFWGDVTANADLLNNNGLLTVTVSSGGGDFTVLWSKLDTAYTYTEGTSDAGAGAGAEGASAAPEPSAALLFAIGGLFVGHRMRRR